MIRHIIPISGKDSLATAIVQIKRQPDLPYEFMFNPTGAELPSVFDWIDKVEKFLGKKIVQVGENLEDIIIDFGYFLPSFNSRYCTRDAKIKPMEKWLGKDECIIYYGIRADENRTGYINASGRLTPVYPLVEEGIGIDGVYEILQTHDLMPPNFFWSSLYEEVARLLGGGDLIKKLLKPWQINMLFAWRTRANCYFCFNQKIYEWVGLEEHYPNLFWNAERMEHLGSDGDFLWNGNGLSLAHIYKNRKKYKKKRINELVKLIRLLSQGVIYFDDNEEGFKDMLATTSCGLFCGK